MTIKDSIVGAARIRAAVWKLRSKNEDISFDYYSILHTKHTWGDIQLVSPHPPMELLQLVALKLNPLHLLQMGVWMLSTAGFQKLQGIKAPSGEQSSSL